MCGRSFIRAPFRLAAELFKFGPAIVPALEQSFMVAMSDETRAHAAALLTELGSNAGVPHLLSLLEHRDRSCVMAALVLGKAKVKEAAPLVTRVLIEWDCVSDPYSAATLIGALKKLDAIPDELRESLRERWPADMTPALETLFR